VIVIGAKLIKEDTKGPVIGLLGRGPLF